MADYTQKTIHHCNLQLMQSLGIPFTVDDFSTLNEKFDIEASTNKPVDKDYPVIKYLTIGRGGHRNVTAAGGASVTDIVRHGPTDSALFETIPFVVRALDDDLSDIDRAKYRLRKVETFHGVQYFTYYLKVIDTDSITPVATITQISGGEVSSTVDYNPSNASLNPTPIEIDNDDLNIADGRYLNIQSTVGISMNSSDIEGIINAVAIIYNDERFANISEVGIVSGFDQNVTTTMGGSTNTYVEVTQAQVVNFIGTETPLQHHPSEVELGYGLVEALPYPLPVI